MSCPVHKSIVAANVSLLFSAPSEGRWLALLEPRETTASSGIAARDGKLYFNREFVKSLTNIELRETLLDIARRYESN